MKEKKQPAKAPKQPAKAQKQPAKAQRAQTAPRAAKAKQAAVVTARLGFESVGLEIGRIWKADPSLLKIEIDGRVFGPDDLIASIEAADALKAPEAVAQAKYEDALKEYGAAHAARIRALLPAWNDFLFVNKHARMTAEYSERTAEAFVPMTTFMREPSEKRKRDQKRAAKKAKGGP